MDSPQQCVPTHCFLRLEPSIVQATSFHQQLPLWMCLPLTHPSSLFSLRRDFSPPPDFRTVRNCPEPLSMRRRTAFLRQGCRILYIVGVCVNRIGTEQTNGNNSLSWGAGENVALSGQLFPLRCPHPVFR